MKNRIDDQPKFESKVFCENVLMSGLSSPHISITEPVQGGDKGQFISTETQKILRKIISIPLQRIQGECNKVANEYHDLWSTKNPNDKITEYGLESTTYEKGIIELDPPFSLITPSTIRISILNSRINTMDSSKSPDASSAVNDLDPRNPILYVFLPTLEITGPIIRWTNYRETFQQIIIHEFLHLYGDSPNQRQGVVDGRIRHNIVPFTAIEPLLH